MCILCQNKVLRVTTIHVYNSLLGKVPMRHIVIAYNSILIKLHRVPLLELVTTKFNTVTNAFYLKIFPHFIDFLVITLDHFQKYRKLTLYLTVTN